MQLAQHNPTSPERLLLDGMPPMGFDHPHAHAFCLLPAKERPCVVSMRRQTHQAMFAVIDLLDPKRLSADMVPYIRLQAQEAQRHPRAHLSAEGIRVFPALAAEHLHWYFKHRTGGHAAFRRLCKSGRVWGNVRTATGVVSVISFWVPARSVTISELRLIRTAMKISGHIIVRGIDGAEVRPNE